MNELLLSIGSLLLSVPIAYFVIFGLDRIKRRKERSNYGRHGGIGVAYGASIDLEKGEVKPQSKPVL